MMDSKETGNVTLNELKKIFKDYRMKVREDDCERLFNLFADTSGLINYHKLLKSLIVNTCNMIGNDEPI